MAGYGATAVADSEPPGSPLEAGRQRQARTSENVSLLHKAGSNERLHWGTRRVLLRGLAAVSTMAAAAIAVSVLLSHRDANSALGANSPLGAADMHHKVSSFVDVYETSYRGGARLQRLFPLSVGSKEACVGPAGPCAEAGSPGTVVVESQRKLQKVLGFGGAFTDAATTNFYKLPKRVQDKVMDAYFGDDGIGYTMGRIPMDSCDFSVEQYSMDDQPGDYDLKFFDSSIPSETSQRIPMIKAAKLREKHLKLFFSPWSPPAWMKTPMDDGNQSMIESAQPQGLLDDPRVLRAWALYFSKFATAYKHHGLKFWGLTIQNEPENSGPWEACVYNASFEAEFLAEYLGPQMHRDHPHLKLMAYDHNKDHLEEWAEVLAANPRAIKYLDGMAFHWYNGGWNRDLDGAYGWDMLDRVRDILPNDVFLMGSESCNCPNVDHELSWSWLRAEKMAHDIITDFNNWASAWVDWNLLLDYEGGPNHARNLCDAPVYCLEDHSDVHFQPMYYYMGHLSKFAPPGSHRLASRVVGNYTSVGMRSSKAVEGYEVTAYGCEGSVRQQFEWRADGKIVLADPWAPTEEWYMPLCLSATNKDFSSAVTLVNCDGDNAGVFSYDNDTGQMVLNATASFPSTPAPTSPPTAAPHAAPDAAAPEEETPAPTAAATPVPAAPETPVPEATSAPAPTPEETAPPEVPAAPETEETPAPTAVATLVPAAPETPVPEAAPTSEETAPPEVPAAPETEEPTTPAPTPPPTTGPPAAPGAAAPNEETPAPTAAATPVPATPETPVPEAAPTPEETAPPEVPVAAETEEPAPPAAPSAASPEEETPAPTAAATPVPAAPEAPVPEATAPPEVPAAAATEGPAPAATEAAPESPGPEATPAPTSGVTAPSEPEAPAASKGTAAPANATTAEPGAAPVDTEGASRKLWAWSESADAGGDHDHDHDHDAGSGSGNDGGDDDYDDGGNDDHDDDDDDIGGIFAVGPFSTYPDEGVGIGPEDATPAPALAGELCLGVHGGVFKDGGLLTLEPCSAAGGASEQAWDVPPAGEAGPIHSPVDGRCMTAGWPFFTGVAFKTKHVHHRSYAVVVLNEAEEEVEFALAFPEEGYQVRASSPARSIRTFLL